MQVTHGRGGRSEGYGRVTRGSFHATIFAERAFAVASGVDVLLMKLLQLASFLKICIVRRGLVIRERIGLR